MIFFINYNISLINIDSIFKYTNKQLAKYLMDNDLPITFDFTDKHNKALYTNFFLKEICETIKNDPTNNQLIFYNNTLTKDVFRNSLIKKVQRIFGFKIYNGVWDIVPFISMLREKDVKIVEEFESIVNCNCKPKNYKHIKKYLEKEGLIFLNDNYFKDIANKMVICG